MYIHSLLHSQQSGAPHNHTARLRQNMSQNRIARQDSLQIQYAIKNARSRLLHHSFPPLTGVQGIDSLVQVSLLLAHLQCDIQLFRSLAFPFISPAFTLVHELAITAAQHLKPCHPPSTTVSAYSTTTRSHAIQHSGCVVRHVRHLATLVAPFHSLPSWARFCTKPCYPEFWKCRAAYASPSTGAIREAILPPTPHDPALGT